MLAVGLLLVTFTLFPIALTDVVSFERELASFLNGLYYGVVN